MALSQSDRIAFSKSIVSAPALAAQIDINKAAIQAQVAQVQQLDNANKNLMVAPNTVINMYQPEMGYINGGTRTTVVEQDLIDASNKILNNHFFPNNTNVTVPSLSSKNNVWAQVAPFALTYAIGKNATESYDNASSSESVLIPLILSYTTSTDPATVIAQVNIYKTTALAEVAAIVTTDTDPTHSANNQAAINAINSQLLPALNAYLSASHIITPDTSILALQAALTIRQTFLATRISQLTAILGNITQDVDTGAITSSSGAYGQRYAIIALRLNSLTGTLAQLANFNTGINAQNQIKSGILSNAQTYSTYVPTSILKTDASNLSIIHVADPSLFSPGDLVYVYAENQDELTRAVKSINNDVITLNDVVPAKYTVTNLARIYKDATS